MIITVLHIESIPGSAWSNPRFKLHTTDGIYTTMSDAAFCYGINNGWNSTHESHGRMARVELTRAGRVRHLKWLVGCPDVWRSRAKLERLRDARRGDLTDKASEAFNAHLSVFMELLKRHRTDTGCTEHH